MVDLAGVNPTGGPVTLNVIVEAVDPSIQILDIEPHAISVTLDRVGTKVVPVHAIVGTVPSGLTVGDPMVDTATATVTGPQSEVAQVTEARAFVQVDASGVDINQDINLTPVDAQGGSLARVDVVPATVRVRLAVFTDLRTKTLPVRPNVVGTPAAGFEIASITVTPPVISVEGDANDLAGLDHADTQPISIAGASSQVVQSGGLALPNGGQSVGNAPGPVTLPPPPGPRPRALEWGPGGEGGA